MRKTIGSLAAVAAAGVLTFAALPVASASAGSNGQELAVCTTPWATRALIEGINQNGEYAREEMDVTPGKCWDGWNVTFAWWWRGTAAISLAGPVGDYKFDHICEVPGKQGTDISRC
jgi:hypothetical protein